MITTYDHHRIGTLQALPAAHGPLTTHADWLAVKPGSERLYGYIVDTRADGGTRRPSEVMPADDDAKPFDSFNRRGRYITSTHSVRGALLAIGNHA